MAKKVAVVTLGCKINLYDSQAMLQKFADAGYDIVDFDRCADIDVCIVNTCCVTNAAEKKSRQMVRKVKSKSGIVAVMGCAGEAAPDSFREIGADITVGTSNRLEIFDFVEGNFQKPVDDAIADFAFVDKISDRTRAFLKIQDGCDNLCTYCIVPHVRGRSRSRPAVDVLTQGQHFAAMGAKEIVISGIHAASYGKDFKGGAISLLTILKQICGIEDVLRIRLSSIEPLAITQQFLDFIETNSKFCNHLHLSLQSGCDRILKLMNRKYSAADFGDTVEKLRRIRPEISITTDIIVGFPTETDAEYAETLNFAEKIGFADIHVFPYAAKTGTVAAGMSGQISSKIKKARATELIALAAKLKKQYQSNFLGQTMEVLVEGQNADGFFVGKTDNYMSVTFKAKSDEELTNQLVPVHLKSLCIGGISGTLS